jgi:hypothetical protein
MMPKSVSQNVPQCHEDIRIGLKTNQIIVAIKTFALLMPNFSSEVQTFSNSVSKNKLLIYGYLSVSK